jgi:hypothetical protein
MVLSGGYAAGVMDGTYIRYGGIGTQGADVNNIESVTAATAGNAVDWADMSVTHPARGAVSSEAGRGVWCGGYITSPTGFAVTCDYITISTQANAVDFGDLTIGRESVCASMSATRGVVNAGATPGLSNVIDYITIGTTGNALDFGDLTVSRYMSGACSGD